MPEGHCAECGRLFRGQRRTSRFCSKSCGRRGQGKSERLRSCGYTYLHRPDHPHANQRGYVAEHRLIVEEVLGKTLPRDAVVHHHNGDRADNRPCNLVVCPDQAYHIFIHNRMRRFELIKSAGGDPRTDSYCPMCKRARHRSEFHRNRRRPSGCDAYCKACSKVRSAAKYQRKLARERKAA